MSRKSPSEAAKTPVEVLQAARTLIERPEAWTKRKFAADQHDLSVPERRAEAIKWCAAGAILRVGPPLIIDNSALEFLREAIGAREIANWNDAPERTHAEVLAAFDAAIALAEKEAGHDD